MRIDVTMLVPLVEDCQNRITFLKFRDSRANFDHHASAIGTGDYGVLVRKRKGTLHSTD
jgi:glutaredoxin-related protein